MGQEKDDNIPPHWRRPRREVAAEVAAVRLEIQDEAHERMVKEANPDVGKIHPIPKWFKGKHDFGNTYPYGGIVYQVVFLSDNKTKAIEAVGHTTRAK